MQLHKTAKKRKAFAVIENFIPISFRLQTKLISCIKRSTTNVLECSCILFNRNELLRTSSILFNVTLCVQLRQV